MDPGQVLAAAWPVLIGAAAGLLTVWVVLALVLWRSSPDSTRIGETTRVLPDLLRLLRRLAADPDLPRGVRVRLALLLVYLAVPIDLIPDFVPVIGYADDVIIIGLTLRSVIRRAGPQVVARHWPGTPEGLEVVRRVTCLSTCS
ncbi:YkvA family protein [Rhodococcus sp. NPDC127530]|uniref:YkvA family protein n=1 Tax=unclassified Rhodococcus (in: high G+C Gram-positive bacteria) TaxID=192944 RepID=UPI00362CFE61